MNKGRKRLSDVRGMTMAELLVVVAIITILAGVAFIMVQRHQRSLGQLERDGIAKEIFVAAQNHLTAAYGQGYLDLPDGSFGTEDTISLDASGNDIKDDYYYVVNGNIQGNSALGQMLPFGSIDETVRSGGSYFVHYQKSTGLVLNVTYCSTNGSPSTFNHILGDDDYAASVSLRGDGQKANRRNVGGYIMGWYGAPGAGDLNTIKLEAPAVKVTNAEKLHVEVTDNNTSNSGKYSLKLIVTGAASGAEKSFVLLKSSGSSETVDTSGRVKASGTTYDVILDDITESGMHFADLVSQNDKSFIPGEDIKIQAVAYSTEAFCNIAYSSEETANSLFSSIDDIMDSSGKTGSTDGVPETAYISNIRHLENLDKAISGLDKNDTFTVDKPGGAINITAAEQANDLDWKNDDTEFWTTSSVTALDGTKTTAGNYMPVNPQDNQNITYSFSYDGKGHKISNIKAENNNAGLFGSSNYITSISNLELIDFDITGTTSAGALAGSLGTDTTANPGGTSITNVIARNSKSTAGTNVTASGSAGGLVGIINAGSVEYSAATLIVGNRNTPGAAAGGLIGTAAAASARTSITGCYSGGHTRNGSYEEWLNTGAGADAHTYDVTAVTAGGLIGDADGADILNSYSTCSVSGTTAGGFVGAASGSISNCYATGLIKMDDAGASNANKTKGAFAGTFTGTAADCMYYSIINEVKKTEGTDKVFDHYLGAVGDSDPAEASGGSKTITAIDENTDSYDDFVGAESSWGSAKAYDGRLIKYYTGKYNLQTIEKLMPSGTTLPDEYSNWDDLFISTHYGDWPAPEIFFLNTAA